MLKLPVPIDIEALSQRLKVQERDLLHRLAQLESRIRTFEDFELPAYESWLRLELGPALVTLEEILNRIYERRLLARRIDQLLQTQSLTPREALYLATFQHESGSESAGPGSSQNEASSSKQKAENKSTWDADEIDARRQAKREAKRAERKANKKQKKEESLGDSSSPVGKKEEKDGPSGTSRLVSLYRALARKLHPDSPISIQGLPASRVLSLWMEVQTAYTTSNMERLLAIAAWVGESGGGDGELGESTLVLSFSDRFDRLRMLTRSCSRLESKLAKLALHPAWEFGSARGNVKRKLRQKAARELEAETASTQEVLDALDDFIESIGSPKVPRGFKSSRSR